MERRDCASLCANIKYANNEQQKKKKEKTTRETVYWLLEIESKKMKLSILIRSLLIRDRFLVKKIQVFFL